jgi:hypothetical protein
MDHVIKLVDYRESKANQRFCQLLEPTFNDLVLIHNDYLIMFSKVRSMLPTADENTSLKSEEVNQAIEAATWLSENRLRLVTLRDKMRTVSSEAAKTSLPKEENDLVVAMVDYFSELSLLSGNSTPSNALKRHLEEFTKEAKLPDPDEEDLVKRARGIRQMIDCILSHQEHHWKNILNKFAKLKIVSAKR